jgi:hypothetical protein
VRVTLIPLGLLPWLKVRYSMKLGRVYEEDDYGESVKVVRLHFTERWRDIIEHERKLNKV